MATALRIFVLLCLVQPIRAQNLSDFGIERFEPVHVGDFWIYRTTIQSGSAGPEHFVMNRVTGDTLVDGKTLFLVRTTEMDPAGNELSASRCTLDLSAGRYTERTLIHDGGTSYCAYGWVAGAYFAAALSVVLTFPAGSARERSRQAAPA